MYKNSYNKKRRICLVPRCCNTSFTAPRKFYFSSPSIKERRDQWLLSMNYEGKISAKTVFYVCEDHFDLQNDLKNAIMVRLMPNTRPILKSEVMPTRFACQDRSTQNNIVADGQQKDLVANVLTEPVIKQCSSDSQYVLLNHIKAEAPEMVTSHQGVITSEPCVDSQYILMDHIKVEVPETMTLQQGEVTPEQEIIAKQGETTSHQEVMPSQRGVMISQQEKTSKQGAITSHLGDIISHQGKVMPQLENMTSQQEVMMPEFVPVDDVDNIYIKTELSEDAPTQVTNITSCADITRGVKRKAGNEERNVESTYKVCIPSLQAVNEADILPYHFLTVPWLSTTLPSNSSVVYVDNTNILASVNEKPKVRAPPKILPASSAVSMGYTNEVRLPVIINNHRVATFPMSVKTHMPFKNGNVAQQVDYRHNKKQLLFTGMVRDKQSKKGGIPVGRKKFKRSYKCQMTTKVKTDEAWQQTMPRMSAGVDAFTMTDSVNVKQKHKYAHSELVTSGDMQYVIEMKLQYRENSKDEEAERHSEIYCNEEQCERGESEGQDERDTEGDKQEAQCESGKIEGKTESRTGDISDEDVNAQSLLMTRELHKRQQCRYLGISKENAWILQRLCKDVAQYNDWQCARIQPSDIIELVLRKIRLNESFLVLGDCFGISQTEALELYDKFGTFIVDLLESVGIRVGLMYNGNGFYLNEFK